jgi:hypothetical protein
MERERERANERKKKEEKKKFIQHTAQALEPTFRPEFEFGLLPA